MRGKSLSIGSRKPTAIATAPSAQAVTKISLRAAWRRAARLLKKGGFERFVDSSGGPGATAVGDGGEFGDGVGKGLATGEGVGLRLMENFYAHARNPKIWWHIPETDHGGSLRARPTEYEQQIISFFDTNLLAK